MPVGKRAVYAAGKSGWMSTPQGLAPMPDAVVRQVRGELLRNLFNAILSDQRAGLTVNALSQTRVEITDKSGGSVRLEFDASGLPAKRIYSGMGPGGATEIEETFSDWREVDGVRLPHKSVVTQGGKPAAEATGQEWKLNSGITAEEVRRKP